MKQIISILFIASAIYACRKQPEIPPAVINEPENITSIGITFTDSANTSKQIKVQWSDFDGTGGNNPTIDSILLKSNATYFVELEILDQTKTPIVNIGEEILQEGTDHQFFYSTSANQITFSYNDQDTKGNPIGLKSKWRTNNPSNGSVRILLKHQPGVKVSAPGDINAGSSDIDITIPSQIQ